MKRIFNYYAIIFTLALFTLIGCKKSESEITPVTITGKWYFESQVGSALLAGKKTDINQINGFDDQSDVYFEFKADGTGNSVDGTFTYTLSGNTLTIKQSGTTTDFTVSLSNSKLNLALGSTTLALITNFYNVGNTAKMTNLELTYTFITEQEANIAFGGPAIPTCLTKTTQTSTNTYPTTYTYDSEGKVLTSTFSSSVTSYITNKAKFGSDSSPAVIRKDATGNTAEYYCNYFGRTNRIKNFDALGKLTQVAVYKYNTDNTMKSVSRDIYNSDGTIALSYFDEFVYENGNGTKTFRTNYTGDSKVISAPKYLFEENTYDKLPLKTLRVYPFNFGKADTNNLIKWVIYNKDGSISFSYDYTNTYDSKGFITKYDSKYTSPWSSSISTTTFTYECK